MDSRSFQLYCRGTGYAQPGEIHPKKRSGTPMPSWNKWAFGVVASSDWVSGRQRDKQCGLVLIWEE